jgi:hypothetical protein
MQMDGGIIKKVICSCPYSIKLESSTCLYHPCRLTEQLDGCSFNHPKAGKAAYGLQPRRGTKLP